MGTDNRAVQHAMLHIWVVGKVGQHPLPHPLIAPAREPFVDTIPVAVFRRQEPPLSSTAVDPEDGFHETATRLLVGPNVGMSVIAQKRSDLRPLFVRQAYGCHTTTVPASGQMSTEPSIGLITALLAEWDRGVTVATAVVNFAAVVCSLAAGHLEAPLHGGTGNLIELFETLVNANVEAEQLIQELLILQRTRPDEDRIMEKVAQANAVANKLRVAEQMLWGRAGG